MMTATAVLVTSATRTKSARKVSAYGKHAVLIQYHCFYASGCASRLILMIRTQSRFFLVALQLMTGKLSVGLYACHHGLPTQNASYPCCRVGVWEAFTISRTTGHVARRAVTVTY